MVCTNPRKPLKDITPPRPAFYLQTYDAYPQYELLIETIRKTLFQGGRFPAWLTKEYDEQGRQRVSPWMNDLIDQGVQAGVSLLLQVTQKELSFLKYLWDDGYEQFADEVLTLPVQDEVIIKGAKAIAGKLIRDQKVIRRPYKLNPDGTRVLRDGKPVKGYDAEMRAVHPVQDRDPDGKLISSWTPAHSTYAAGVTGERVSTGNPNASNNQMLNKLQKNILHELLEKHLGQDDAEFLIDYHAGRFPESDETAEMAELLTLKLAPYRTELEQFRSLLT